MKFLTLLWWRRADAAPSETLVHADQRPQLAASMCCACGRRWLAGKTIYHNTCLALLGHAFDEHFERLHDET